MSLMETAVEIAVSQIGVREEKANWGKKVSEYLKRSGYNIPQPWCASFVYWCIDEAALKTGYPNPFTWGHPKGYVPDWDNWARKHDKIVFAGGKQKKRWLRKGDLFTLYYANLKRPGHIGFVLGVDGDTVSTVEGNTNSRGGREGIEVAKRVRSLSSLYTVFEYEPAGRGDWGIVYDFIMNKIPEPEQNGHPALAALNRLKNKHA